MCSIHLDDATAAIVRHNAHHTPIYWWRGDRVMKSLSVWGWLGGHDGQRPVGEFGQDAGVTLLLFFEGHPGIFNDHRESWLGLTSHPKDGALYIIVSHHYTGALGPTQTTGRAPPAGLTNTSSSRNVVFPGGLPSRYWPAQPCLASVGNRSWAAAWYWAALNYITAEFPKLGVVKKYCRVLMKI